MVLILLVYHYKFKDNKMDNIFLEKKQIITDNNGNEILDFVSKSIDYGSEDATIIDQLFLTSAMRMRPDLLSYNYYGSTDHWSEILKFNNISNPFSIDTGDFVMIPELSFIDNQIPKDDQKKIESLREQYIDTTKKIETDTAKLEYLQKVNDLLSNVSTSRISSYNLPPNITEPGKGEEGTVQEDGSVVLGQF
jgi:hypothetical protein